jgi:hypothetical protein
MEREIRELKRLVGELESGCGFLTQQVRAVHLDSLNFQVLTNNRFHKVDGRCGPTWPCRDGGREPT